MFYFFKLAIGNLIKNRRSSITILIVVFVCIFFMQFGMGYMDGFKVKLTSEMLDNTGHVKIYNKTFYDELDFSMLDYNVAYNDKFVNKIKAIDGVKTIRAEINFGVIANSPDKNLESVVKAIDPASVDENYEKRKRDVVEGRFLEKDGELVVGYKAAKLLKVGLGDKIILLSVDQYGSINAVEGVIVGLSKANNSTEDERTVVCSLGFAQKLLGLEGRVTEIAVNFDDPMMAVEKAELLQGILEKDDVAVAWQVEKAFLATYLDMFDIVIFIMAFIIIFAGSLGVINSFLMNVMNRLPEFGILRAIGLGKNQLLMMILTESFFLGLIGTLAAMIPGTLLVKYFEANPFSYEKMWKMMEGSGFSGMDATMATVMLPATVAVIFLTGVSLAVVASVYPALIATRKKPSEILRSME